MYNDPGPLRNLSTALRIQLPPRPGEARHQAMMQRRAEAAMVPGPKIPRPMLSPVVPAPAPVTPEPLDKRLSTSLAQPAGGIGLNIS